MDFYSTYMDKAAAIAYSGSFRANVIMPPKGPTPPVAPRPPQAAQPPKPAEPARLPGAARPSIGFKDQIKKRLPGAAMSALGIGGSMVELGGMVLGGREPDRLISR